MAVSEDGAQLTNEREADLQNLCAIVWTMCFTEVLIKLVFKGKSPNLTPSWKPAGYCKMICVSGQIGKCSFFR